MIKKYLIALLLFISICSYSQENKNKFMINGNAQYQSNNFLNKRDFGNNNTGRYSDLLNYGSANVNFGYFLSTNFAVGISAFVNSYVLKSRSEFTNYYSEFDSKNLEKGCGIFARYNHSFNSSKFGGFLLLSTNYYLGNVNTTQTSPNPNGDPTITKNVTKKTGTSVIFNPGLIYFINSKFSVESTLGSIYYTSGKTKPGENQVIEKTSRLSADLSLTNFNLGFTYYFGGKKA